MADDFDDDNGSETEIIVEVGGPPTKQTEADSDSGGDEELSSYSQKVQSRISRITEKYRKEQRDREEAVRVAEALLEKNKHLEKRVQALDTGFMSEYGARLDSQEAAIKNAYRAAHEQGDTEGLLAAQEDLSRIIMEKQRYATAKQRSASEAAAPRQEQEVAIPQQRQKPDRADPRAETWAEKNKWFGEDRIMTTAALAIHQMLVEDEGFDPNAEEYYTEIDRRLRSEFPNKFTTRKTGGSQVAPAGSSASRSMTQERRSVRLTPSQVAIAKRLNVPLEEYAKYVKD